MLIKDVGKCLIKDVEKCHNAATRREVQDTKGTHFLDLVTKVSWCHVIRRTFSEIKAYIEIYKQYDR